MTHMVSFNFGDSTRTLKFQVAGLKQLTPQPTPRNIYPHAIEGGLNARVRHLLRGVRSCVRMRHAASS